MRPIIIFFFLISISGAAIFLFLNSEEFLSRLQEDTSSPVVVSQSNEGKEIIKEEETEELSREEIVRQKIEKIKKRLALKGLIIQGDSYFRGGQLPFALKKYLEFYKQNPEDPLIHEKIGDTYFEMHKYPSATNYYSKIVDMTLEQKLKLAMSYFYATDLFSVEEKQKTRGKILALELEPEQEYYFINSLSCSDNFHECKKSFGEYFWPENAEEIESEEMGIPEITYNELENIKSAIENYRNFKLDDVYLKDAYIIGAYYSNRLYNLAVFLGEQLLQEKTDYKPILKIVAQSYFELGEYEKARSVFSSYYEIDPTDPGVVYTLGIINTKLREYVLANINFHKALELGYENTHDIYRQLIMNYYVLENDESMLENFRYLIGLGDFTQEDLQLAIYYHIIHEEYDIAIKWSQLGQSMFEESGNFHAYHGWILRERGENETAKEILLAGLEREKNNPFVLINLAYTHLGEENTGAAIVVFKQVLLHAPESEFAIQSQKELDSLSDNEN